MPLIFVLGSAWLLANTLLEEPCEAGLGAIMLGVGVVTYGFWKRQAGPSGDAVSPASPLKG